MEKFQLIVQNLSRTSGKGFKFLAGINREVVPSQLRALERSVKKVGVLRCVIVAKLSFISGKPEYYIIDGQHLYLVLTNMPEIESIPYIVLAENIITDEKSLIKAIALLNNSSKSWTLANYVDSWAYTNKDYKTLNRMFNEYKIEKSLIAEILLTNEIKYKTPGGNNSITKVVKEGNFKIKDLRKSVRILDEVKVLFTKLKKEGAKRERIRTEIATLVDSIILREIKSEGKTEGKNIEITQIVTIQNAQV